MNLRNTNANREGVKEMEMNSNKMILWIVLALLVGMILGYTFGMNKASRWHDMGGKMMMKDGMMMGDKDMMGSMMDKMMDKMMSDKDMKTMMMESMVNKMMNDPEMMKMMEDKMMKTEPVTK